jgi:AraC-like DNA-binding protein
LYRLFPDGCVDLTADDAGVVLCGPETSGWSFRVPTGSTSVGLRFEPGAFTALFGQTADALLNCRVRLDDVVSAKSSRILAERLACAPSPEHRRRVLVDYVRSVLDGTSPVRRVGPDPMARALIAADPSVDVADIAADVGVSRRHLHRVAVRTLGYGPSMVKRVMRTQRALAAMRSAVPMTLAEIAVVSGFSDQAHMTREFRAICATTPALARLPRAAGGNGTDAVHHRSSLDETA